MKISSHIYVLAFILFPLFVSNAQEIKDPNPPVLPNLVGPLAVSPTGGPDDFGYTFADQTAGCTFDFIDISATGQFIVDGDDNSSGPVSLGAPIDIYGEIFDSLVMATNGYISTDPTDEGPDLSNDCPLPQELSSGGGARLYPLHSDLVLVPDIGEGLIQYFEECPRASDTCETEDCTIFYYDNLAHFPAGPDDPTWDMEVILYHQSNNIVYQIGPGDPEMGSNSTTGIQNFPPPTTGLTYACNEFGSVPGNTAVCIFHPEPLCPVTTRAIPTLSEWGLLAMAGLFGIIGFMVLRRRKAAA